MSSQVIVVERVIDEKRIGATIGPLAGGFLISMHLPTQKLFMIATILLEIGVVVAAVITPLYRKQVLAADGTLVSANVDAPMPLGGQMLGETL